MLKAKPAREALFPITATYPLQLVHGDFLTIENPRGDKEVITVIKDVVTEAITDHFTRYEQALVTHSQTAKVMVHALWNQIVVHYGLPKSILSDQGCNLERKDL